DSQDDEDDWAADDSVSAGSSLEVQAEQGELPFIFDNKDDSNSQVKGLPSDLVLTPSLLSYFQTMFGEGRTVPWLRPSLHARPRLLASAADA
ncbi:serine/threonine protein kinase, partial [Salmonella enterica]|nr:serine/threonine protein kinase [Salmonella enterica]